MWLGNAPEYEPDTGGPDGTEDVSGSMVSASEGPQFGSAEGDGMPVPPMLQWSPEPVAAPAPAPQARQTSARKTKARTVYSSEQLRVLNNRFEVQKYLTPKEMEDLAKSIGLTYKQVKTWFQNNRMLLKRQQKDDSWMSERYMVRNPQRTPSQVNVPTLSQDQNSPGASSYLNSSRALSPSLGSPGPWGSWHVPPAVQHGEFLNSSGDVPVGGNAYNGNVMFVDPGSSSTQMVEVHSTTQWSF